MFGVGGMPKWLFRLAGQLNDDFDFYFIATHSDYIVPEYRDVATVVVLPFRKWPLANYLFTHRIDLAQVANLRLYTDASRLAQVPSVVERVDGLRSGAALSDKRGLDLVIASTFGIVSHIEKMMPPEDIHVIYNGVDLEAFDQSPIERFAFGAEDIVIGRTSRLSGGKNISLLIAAVKELRKRSEYANVRLVICGGDTTQPGSIPMLDTLKAEAEVLGDSVVFTGEVLNTVAITKGYDIATCTSRPDNEGIPNSLLEAMAASKPVVASSVGDIPEIVQDGENGFLFRSDDLVGLVAALARLVDDAKLREKMGAAGRNRIEQDFDLKKQSEAYRLLYWELIECKGRHPLTRLIGAG